MSLPEKIRLAGRSSRLSIVQMNIVKQKIQQKFPAIEVEIIAMSSQGDRLPDIALQTVDDTDFFTQEIFNSLLNNEADIAVHALKDISGAHFFGGNIFSVVEREDARDVAIFNSGILNKLQSGTPITIGTCSPRREEMATQFLQKALPFFGKAINLTIKPLRGNIDTRLQKLHNNEFDGIIIAAAGINRLLNSAEDALNIQQLLADKKLLFLPLIECVPAPCQGAIVAEAMASNSFAVTILAAIKEETDHNNCVKEKLLGLEYGAGCLQKFGVTTVSIKAEKIVYAAGKNSEDIAFSKWYNLPALRIENGVVFSSTDYMRNFFNYTLLQEPITLTTPIAFVANYKAIHQPADVHTLQQKRVWVAGTKTWLALAKQGIWVEGSADALGLESLLPFWKTALVNIHPQDITIVTNQTSAANWQLKGYKTAHTYDLIFKEDEVVANKIKVADYIFWTSYRQYEQYKTITKEGVQHLCPAGETANLLKAEGIEPIIFPNIKAFLQWRQTNYIQFS